jgi:transcriptional regulator with XRE-family HTH domain
LSYFNRSKMTIEQKKDWAKLLFLKETMSQKEIAKKVEISEQTLSKWINKERWDKLKQSIVATREEQLRIFYIQLQEFNASIMLREEGNRFPDSKESDILIKLTNAIEKLERDTSISDHINSFTKFNEYVRKIAPIADVQKIVEFQDAFIRSLL